MIVFGLSEPGRGSEEALFLLREGIPFEVIPGISAGLGVTALAGIPLTHRGLSGSAARVSETTP